LDENSFDIFRLLTREESFPFSKTFFQILLI